MAPPNKESHQADLLWWCTESCWTLCVVASQDHHYKPPWHPQKFWVSEGNWWVNGEFPPNLCTFLCMAVKIHFFLSHLDYFHKNCRDFSVELCECFPQDISDMEKGYHMADGMSIFWVTTAGAGREMWSQLSTNGSPWRDHSSISSFLSSLYSSCYLFKIFCNPLRVNQSNMLNIVSFTCKYIRI